MDGTRDDKTPRDLPADERHPDAAAAVDATDTDEPGDSESSRRDDSPPSDAAGDTATATSVTEDADNADNETTGDTESDTAEPSDRETDILAVRRPRPSASNPDDPFGPEPEWLQAGSGKRTALGVAASVILLGVVAGIGWVTFRPDETTAAENDPPGQVACQVAEHDDGGMPVQVPVPTLGEAPPRQT
ncbi:MAG: hypothetical protein ACRD0P_30405, partial [Stackebrandtia sp.]